MDMGVADYTWLGVSLVYSTMQCTLVALDWFGKADCSDFIVVILIEYVLTIPTTNYNNNKNSRSLIYWILFDLIVTRFVFCLTLPLMAHQIPIRDHMITCKKMDKDFQNWARFNPKKLRSHKISFHSSKIKYLCPLFVNILILIVWKDF